MYVEKRSFYCAFSLFWRLTDYLREAISRQMILLNLRLLYDEMMLAIG
jgi:hypothetical protein